MTESRARREAAFQEARAAVLSWQLRLVDGATVVLIEREELFALRIAGERPDVHLGNVAAQFLRLADGTRTVGQIIESIAGDMAVAEAIAAGKVVMAAVHEFYLDGVVENAV